MANLRTERRTERRTLASIEAMAQYWRDESERYRSHHAQAPASPNGRRFTLYAEWSAGCIEEAKALRASLAKRTAKPKGRIA
jgi:hypothetical protein